MPSLFLGFVALTVLVFDISDSEFFVVLVCTMNGRSESGAVAKGSDAVR